MINIELIIIYAKIFRTIYICLTALTVKKKQLGVLAANEPEENAHSQVHPSKVLHLLITIIEQRSMVQMLFTTLKSLFAVL